jgi:hypothetical protein
VSTFLTSHFAGRVVLQYNPDDADEAPDTFEEDPWLIFQLETPEEELPNLLQEVLADDTSA